MREELERYLPAARQQAADRVRSLIKDGAATATIVDARTELAYVRHAKGPVYQSHLLTYLGVRQVDAVITKEQSPLERVREIGAALGVKINAQQSVHLQRAIRSFEQPALAQGHSPGQERLAELFLKNTPEKNNADPRLAPAQTIVDTALNTARNRGESVRMISNIGESTRQLVANRIRAGSILDSKFDQVAPTTIPLPPNKDRSR